MEDETSESIRNYLNSPENEDISDFTGDVYPLTDQESVFEDGYIDYYHLGALFTDEKNNLWCCIRIFDTFEGCFIIIKKANVYNSPNKFLAIDSISGEVDFKDF